MCCAEDGVFKLATNVVKREDGGEEGGGCFAWLIKVFSKLFDAHEAREAGDAADGDEVFPVDVDAYDVSSLDVNGPSEVAGGVNIILHVHPLVMVRGDESEGRGGEGVHWWAVDVHDRCTIWAEWVDEEGLVGECLTEGGFNEKDSSG